MDVSGCGFCIPLHSLNCHTEAYVKTVSSVKIANDVTYRRWACAETRSVSCNTEWP